MQSDLQKECSSVVALHSNGHRESLRSTHVSSTKMVTYKTFAQTLFKGAVTMFYD